MMFGPGPAPRISCAAPAGSRQQRCKCGHGPWNMGGNHDTKGSIQDLRGQSLGSVALLSAMATENPDLLLKNLSHDGRPLGFINCIAFRFYLNLK